MATMPRSALRLALPLLLSLGCRSAAPSTEDGRFRAEYGPAAPALEGFRTRLVEHQFLDTMAVRLSDSIRIPEDITLAIGHCAEPNASYEPTRRRVTVCYELVENLSETFADEPGEEYLISGTIMFAMMHELAHALIDVLKLPITGREEDAADQLATVLLLQQGAAGDSLAFGAVGWFALHAKTDQLDSLAFADDHGFNLQRVFNIICWVYGRDPDRYPQIVSEGWLPEPRRTGCRDEYARLAASWERLLRPHGRPPARTAGIPTIPRIAPGSGGTGGTGGSGGSGGSDWSGGSTEPTVVSVRTPPAPRPRSAPASPAAGARAPVPRTPTDRRPGP